VFLAVFSPKGSDDVSPEATLLHRLLRKDVSAFEEIYERHSRIVYSLVLRILRQGSTAEEVVQDVFLQLWRNSGQYDAKRPFMPWLLTLARNRALDQLRLKSERQRRREEQTEVFPQIAAAAPEYEEALDEKRRAERVRTLITSLPSAQKKAIELAYFEGLSHSEIAEALNEPLGTVKSWIRNGLLRLKDGLKARS